MDVSRRVVVAFGLLTPTTTLALSLVSIEHSDTLSWSLLLVSLMVVGLFACVIFLWMLNRRLLRSKHKLTVLWHHVPDVLTEVNQEGEICAVNQPLREGVTVEQLVGTSSFDYLSKEDAEVFREHLNKAFSQRRETQYELVAHLADGVHHLSNRIIPLSRVDHEPRALIITSDISHFREAERILNQAKTQAEENAQSKTRFLANMSHEIRTPLNGIVGLVSIIEDTYDTEDMRQLTQPLKASVDHLHKIVDDILDLAKSNAGEIQLDVTDVSLWQLLDDLEALYLTQALEKQNRFTVTIAPSVPRMIRVDGFRLRQVLYNLMSNAVKFTEQGRIELFVDQHELPGERVIRFRVKDSGVGIPKDQQSHIFDAFSQAHASVAQQHGGTGLGLSISRNLIETMGGVIGVDSDQGRGAEFWFTLPFADVEGLAAQGLVSLPWVYLSIKDEAKQRWFEGFFAALNISIEIAQKIDDLPVELDGLLVTDGLKASNIKHIWWLGLDYEQPSSHAWVLNEPYRRESLFQRLQEYSMGGTAATADADKESGKLLLVEDNMTNQLVVRKTLEKLGYEVDVANNGQEGVDAHLKGHYSGIIMDIQMPIMDGIEATRRIRQSANPYVPIIALTANAQSDIEAECFAAGMDAFLTKPVDRVALQQALEAFIGVKTSKV